MAPYGLNHSVLNIKSFLCWRLMLPNAGSFHLANCLLQIFQTLESRGNWSMRFANQCLWKSSKNFILYPWERVWFFFLSLLFCCVFCFLRQGCRCPEWPWNITDVGFEFLIFLLLPQSAEISGYASLCPVAILSLLYGRPLPLFHLSRMDLSQCSL